jgi:hypothetical protein
MVPSAFDILRLLRIHTGAATAMVPSITAHICGADPAAVLLIFLAGLSHHAWGFSLNEILDLEVDRKAGVHLSEKPLVSGKMGIGTAWAISTFVLALTFAFMICAAIMSDGPVAAALVLLGASSVCVGIYDIWSKKIPFMDLFVGLWYGLLIVSAAVAAGIPSDLITIVSLIAAASGLHLLFNNMIEGGLKDAKTDEKAHVRSAAVILGVRGVGDRIEQPRVFIAVAFALRGLFVITVCIIAYLAYVRGGHEVLLIAVPVLGIALFAHSFRFVRPMVRMDRTALLRTFSLHEIASYVLSILAVSYVAGIPASIVVIIVPVVWFALFNRLMYRRMLAPKV